MKLQNICKTYANKVRAVNGINIKMYADQIFVLLGHNGAGKTSVISILTGLYNPTEGEAEVFGHDIFNDFDAVRQFIGICP
jgi:ATP-binding cassette subfamily A (ABC1) protein 3